MKQLVCDMCGGTDMLKQDGVFVCQACGMKYSVEEAKKMMIEGTVEVQGTVQVSNTASVENLMRLAQSSYNSKNYAQAEEFCNQAIAMNAACHEAWKLKGEAINLQINAENDRIEEVYNCIMTAYQVLDEAGQNEKREEYLLLVRQCLESEIDFALSLFKNNRPSHSTYDRVQRTVVNCAKNVISAYRELGYSEVDAVLYEIYIKNYFIQKVNAVCASTWDEVVYYNYHRDGFNDYYHPDLEIMKTYIDEGNQLIVLLYFAEQMFNGDTTEEDKRENYKLQIRFHSVLCDAHSYKRMVETTTNGYGAELGRREYWQQEASVNADQKKFRQGEIDRLKALVEKMDMEKAETDPQFRQERLDALNRQLKAAQESAYGVLSKPGCAAVFCAIFCALAAIACIIMSFIDDSFIILSIVGCVVFILIGVITLAKSLKSCRKYRAEKLQEAEKLKEEIRKFSQVGN